MKRKAIGLEIDDQVLDLVQVVREQGQIHVERREVVKLPPDVVVAGKVKDETLLKEAVASLVGKSFFQSIPIIVGISSLHAFIRKIDIPIVPSREMGQLIRWEGENILPCPIDEVYYSYQILGDFDLEYQVLFVAAPKNQVQPYQKIFRQLKLPIISLTLQPFGLLNCLDGLEWMKDYTGVIARFRLSAIDFIVLHQGQIELIRTVSVSEEFALSRDVLVLFQDELFATLQHFHTVSGIWINSGLFSGEREYLQEIRTQFPTFRWRHLFSSVSTQSGEENKGNELSCAWGLGLLGVNK